MELFWELMSPGWTDWERLFSATRVRDYLDKTVTNAVWEGVNFGALRKMGGRGTNKVAMVGITPLGMVWFVRHLEVKAPALVPVSSLECYACGRPAVINHPQYGPECERCSAVPEENPELRRRLETHNWPDINFVDTQLNLISREDSRFVSPHGVKCQDCGATAWTAPDVDCSGPTGEQVIAPAPVVELPGPMVL